MELFASLMPRQYEIEELLECNADTAYYGLELTKAQALELAEAHSRTLRSLGRVELGEGVTVKLIRAFSTSPYMDSNNYAEQLGELVECFYEYKNETLDLMGDDELIDRMHALFDGVCKGSMELLAERELEGLARSLRYGYSLDEEEGDDDEYEA